MESEKPQTYSFVLLLGGVSEITEELERALGEAGCTDALLGVRNAVVYLDFDREAAGAEIAVQSAIRQVERGTGARVLRVEPDDIVSQAEIARRTGRPRETVRLWIEGERGSGDFPPPYTGITGRSLLWRWVDVARWLVAKGKLHDEGVVELADVISRINGALDLRQHGNDYRAELTRLATSS